MSGQSQSLQYMHAVDIAKQQFSNYCFCCRGGSESTIVANGSPTCGLHSPHLRCGLHWYLVSTEKAIVRVLKIIHITTITHAYRHMHIQFDYIHPVLQSSTMVCQKESATLLLLKAEQSGFSSSSSASRSRCVVVAARWILPMLSSCWGFVTVRLRCIFWTQHLLRGIDVLISTLELTSTEILHKN